MPRIFVFGQYVLFFWIAENGEPVHIHVGVKRAAANSTKFWLTKNGGCTLANNESKIPAKDLRIADVDGRDLPVTPLVLQSYFPIARNPKTTSTTPGSRTLFPETAREQNSPTSCAAIALCVSTVRRTYKI